MNTKQLMQGLEQAFVAENHRIVLWYDQEQAFVDTVNKLKLPDVQLINMAEAAALQVKFQLELEDTSGKYLLYFPQPEPELEDDWFLDIKLYSRVFHADRISMIFNELGLQRPSLREHLRLRELFLASKARIAALGKLLPANADEDDIDMAMIAVLLSADAIDVATLLFTL